MARRQPVRIACSIYILLIPSAMVGCGGGGGNGSGGPQPPTTGSGRPTEAEIRSVAPPTLEQFAQVVRSVAAEHPNTDQNSAEFSRLVFERFKNSPVSTQHAQPRSYEIGGVRLTAQEWILVVSAPGYALKTDDARTKAESASRIAFPETVARAGYLTKQDAFRHSYWNILMAKTCTLQWARDFATAHESEPVAGYEDDRQMDLSNNAAGRRIYQANPNADEMQFQTLLKGQRYEHTHFNVTIDDSRLVYMRPYQISQIDVAPANSTINVGQSITLSATPKSLGGRFVNTMGLLRPTLVTWSSASPTIAAVSATSGEQPGEIKATIRGVRSGTAQITVTITEDSKKISQTTHVQVHSVPTTPTPVPTPGVETFRLESFRVSADYKREDEELIKGSFSLPTLLLDDDRSVAQAQNGASTQFDIFKQNYMPSVSFEGTASGCQRLAVNHTLYPAGSRTIGISFLADFIGETRDTTCDIFGGCIDEVKPFNSKDSVICRIECPDVPLPNKPLNLSRCKATMSAHIFAFPVFVQGLLYVD